jgi:hypothetical protein
MACYRGGMSVICLFRKHKTVSQENKSRVKLLQLAERVFREAFRYLRFGAVIHLFLERLLRYVAVKSVNVSITPKPPIAF